MSGNSMSLCVDCETVECCMSNGCRVPVIQPCDIREVSYKEREDWKTKQSLKQQIAGTHYKDMVIQPVEYVQSLVSKYPQVQLLEHTGILSDRIATIQRFVDKAIRSSKPKTCLR